MPGPGPPAKKVIVPQKFDTLDLADISVFDFERLQHFALAVYTEMQREMATVQAYQAERDQLLNFWTITSHQCRETISELKDAVLEVEIKQDHLTQKVAFRQQGLMKQRADESKDVTQWLRNKASEVMVQNSITLKKERQIWQDLQELKNKLIELQVDLRECITNSYMEQQNRSETIMKDFLQQRRFDLDRLAYEDTQKRDALYEKCSQRHLKEYTIKNKVFNKMHKTIWCEQLLFSLDIRRMRRHNVDTVVKLKEKAEELVRMDEWQSRYAHRLSKEVSEELKQRVAGYKLAQELQMHMLGKAEPRCLESKIIQEKLPLIEYNWNKMQFLRCYIDIGIETLEDRIQILMKKLFKLHSLLYNNDINIMISRVSHILQKLYDMKLVLFNLLKNGNPIEAARIDMEKETGLTFKTKTLNSLWENIAIFRMESRALTELLNRLIQITQKPPATIDQSFVCIPFPLKKSYPDIK